MKMKRILSLSILLTVLFSCCACTGSSAEVVLPEVTENELTASLLTADVAASPLTTTQTSTLQDPITIPDAELALRQKVVDKMNEMATYKWTTPTAITYKCYPGGDGCGRTYPAGTVIQGLPYNHMGGSLSRLEYCLDGKNGNLQSWAAVNGYDGFDSYIGADCSTALYRAWATVCTSLPFEFPRTRYQCPHAKAGSLPVGDYKWDLLSGAGTGEKYFTAQITEASGVQTMYEAYAQLRRGDGVTNMVAAGGHTRMATSEAYVYRFPDGSIDGEKSYVLFTQCGGVGWHSDDGGKSYTHWGVNDKYTFAQLYNTSYIPFTCKELKEGKTESSRVKLDGRAGSGKAALVNGTVTSNYDIDYVSIEFSTGSGTVYTSTLFPGLAKRDDFGTTNPLRSPHKEFNMAYFASALRSAPLTAGTTYTCKITATLMSGETETLSTVSVTW